MFAGLGPVLLRRRTGRHHVPGVVRLPPVLEPELPSPHPGAGAAREEEAGGTEGRGRAGPRQPLVALWCPAAVCWDWALLV